MTHRRCCCHPRRRTLSTRVARLERELDACARVWGPLLDRPWPLVAALSLLLLIAVLLSAL